MALRRCPPGACPLCDDSCREERNADLGPECPVLVGTVECAPSYFIVLRQFAEILDCTDRTSHDYIYSVRLTERDYELEIRPRQRQGHLIASVRPETPKERKQRRYARLEAEEHEREYEAEQERQLDRYRSHPKHPKHRKHRGGD